MVGPIFLQIVCFTHRSQISLYDDNFKENASFKTKYGKTIKMQSPKYTMKTSFKPKIFFSIQMFLLSVRCTWERVQNDPYMVLVLVHFLKVMPGSRTACLPWLTYELSARRRPTTRLDILPKSA